MNCRNIASVLLILICSFPTLAGQNPINLFGTGSYSDLLSRYQNKPFVLVIWSVTCSSCLKEMALLASLHKNQPDLKIVMLATDDNSVIPEIQALLDKHKLADIENWVFASDNLQKLRFEIDPTWYGELPRTYFFDASHQREGISGVLGRTDYEAHIAEINP